MDEDTEAESDLGLAAELLALHSAVRLLVADRYKGHPEQLTAVRDSAVAGALNAIRRMELDPTLQPQFEALVKEEFEGLFAPFD